MQVLLFLILIVMLAIWLEEAPGKKIEKILINSNLYKYLKDLKGSNNKTHMNNTLKTSQ